MTRPAFIIAWFACAGLLASTALSENVARKHGASRLSGLGPDDNPLTYCRTKPHVGVISIILPETEGGSKGVRSVWHRHGPIDSDPPVEDPRNDNDAHVNEPGARGDPFDIYLSDTGFRPTGKALVRVLLPNKANYQFYEKGDIHGITKANSRDTELCGLVETKGGPKFTVAQFAIDLPKVALARKMRILPDYSAFNIVIEDKGLGHNGVRHLDPKVHNEGYPLVRKKRRHYYPHRP